MVYDNNMYCSKCKVTSVPLVKYARRKLKEGGYKQYYYCNPCNTERVSEYLKTEDGKQAFKRAYKKNIEKHPDRFDAWKKANYAEHVGKLTKKPCEVCGDAKVHKHHPDPSKPFDVVYLCPYHHKQEHQKVAK